MVVQSSEPIEPYSVSRFEYNLLRLLKFLLGQAPMDQSIPLIQNKFTRPPCLSRTCVNLVEDTLSKGLTLYLVRSGGWRRERHLRGGKPIEGRVWERIPLEERVLTFSEHTLQFLVWL